MKIKLIVAHDENLGIGKNNDLMWHLPRDMKFFKDSTLDHVVIMGRKNYDSIPLKYRPFSNRLNVILSRNTAFEAEGCLTFTSLSQSLDYFKEEKKRDIYIIGGGQIYKEALALGVVEEMYITTVHHKFDADTFFPKLELKDWTEELLFEQEVDERHQYSFTVNRYYKS